MHRLNTHKNIKHRHTKTYTNTHRANLCGVSNSICLSALSLILFSSSLSRSLFFYNSSHTEPLLPYSSSSSHHPAPLISVASLARFVSFSPIVLFFCIILFRCFNLSSLLLSAALFLPLPLVDLCFLLYYSAVTHYHRPFFQLFLPLPMLPFHSLCPSILTTCFCHLKILKRKTEKNDGEKSNDNAYTIIQR